MHQKCLFIDSVLQHLGYVNVIGDVALFIACQFALESNFGKSDLAIKQRNYSGMKTPSVRFTTVLHSDLKLKFARYDGMDDCIVDYLLLLAWNHFTQSDFLDLNRFKSKLAKSNYCPEKSYIDKITSIYSQFKSLKNGTKS